MTLHVITGPPCAGKSTWIKDRAQPGDIVIDFDLLTTALIHGGGRALPQEYRTYLQKVRRAAIDNAIPHAQAVNVFIIDTQPSPQQVKWYERNGATVTTLDPGQAVVTERALRERPPAILEVIERYYSGTHADPTEPAPTPTRRW